jgi:hypothetical protein
VIEEFANPAWAEFHGRLADDLARGCVSLNKMRRSFFVRFGLQANRATNLLWRRVNMPERPEHLPTYRLLTGKDDDSFCWRVSEALSLGYILHGSPAITFNGEHCVVAQALLWRTQV